MKTTHTEVIITKRGKPNAKLGHIAQQDEIDRLLGALEGLGRTLGDLTQPVVDAKDWEIN